MVNPYAPDESYHDLVAETEWLQGAMLSGILYGVEVTLFIICFKLLVQQMRRANYKRQCILLAFITTVFTLGTLLMYSIADMTQLSFINDRNFPGGPAAYEVQMYWIPVDEVGVVAMVVGNWFMDALLVSLPQSVNKSRSSHAGRLSGLEITRDFLRCFSEVTTTRHANSLHNAPSINQ